MLTSLGKVRGEILETAVRSGNVELFQVVVREVRMVSRCVLTTSDCVEMENSLKPFNTFFALVPTLYVGSTPRLVSKCIGNWLAGQNQGTR